ncbi:uncharacterized protein LOC113539157 isoform X1 [Pangasianodon hypophthalmus]|uniref:uncharacterized protein LOC113539157 isoform X1 n=1 Tax=Pangasianodon hypophthalmus TaxID=310915 RepID=UPI000EFEA819|nr:uncharacterized protein LOC113539157 isoform X1 [Pangasianodon hypophthalmus]
MNMLIIFVLLFTITLKAKGTNGDNDTSPSPGEEHTSYSETNQVTTGETKLSTGCKGTPNCSALYPSPSPSPNATDDKKEDRNSVTQPTNTTSDDHSKAHNTPECESKAGRENKDDLAAIMHLDLRTVLIFLLGVICSTIIFSTVSCFVIICNRCRTTDAKQKENIILEAVKSEHDPSDEDQADEQAPLQVQTPAEVSTNTSALNSGKIERAGEVKEVDYASINYSLLQKKADGDLKPQKVESDYAEIQLKKQSEGEEVETLQDGVKPDEMKQREVKQDRVDQGLEGGMESQKQVELEEVQV